MAVSLLLVLITSVCHLIDLKYTVPSQIVNFSGESLLDYRFYTLFTSSFFHGNTSHLLKELTLLLPLSILVESQLGSLYFIAFYFLFGVIGCILTWIVDRRFYAKHWPESGPMADMIWSRGSSGNVYGLITFGSTLYGQHLVFEDVQIYGYDLSQFGLFWCIVTIFLWHICSVKSHFYHNPLRAYSVLVTLGLLLFVLLPSIISFNWYLSAYFVSTTVYRIYPGLFNQAKRSEFVAADFKCHLFAALFGYVFGVIMLMNGYSDCSLLELLSNSIQFVTILISDGYCGQYKAHKRVMQRIREQRKRG